MLMVYLRDFDVFFFCSRDFALDFECILGFYFGYFENLKKYVVLSVVG